jgi:hypothetical protein
MMASTDMMSPDSVSRAKERARDEMTKEMQIAWARTTKVRGRDVQLNRLGIYACATVFGTAAYALARGMLLRSAEDGALMAAVAGAVMLVAAVFPWVCRAALRRWYVGTLTEGAEMAVMSFVFAATSLPLLAVMIPVVILSLAAAADERIAGMWGFLLLLWLIGNHTRWISLAPAPSPPPPSSLS